jgi:hypothetical protein
MYQNKEVAMRSPIAIGLRLRIFYACRPIAIGLRSAAGCGTIKSGLKKRYCPAFGRQAWHYKAGFFYAPAGKGRQAYVSVQAGLMCTFWSV